MSFGKVEVLAPAGRVSDIVPLLENGADAVYVGLSGYSARPKSSDFLEDEIIGILPAVHDAGKKLYVAVNANIPSEKTESLCAAVSALDESGIDALIVSEHGLMRRLMKHTQNAAIHASTLTGIYNHEEVRMLQELGVKRIILSSDLFVDEIVDIIDKVPDMEYEIVADGGICFNSNRQCLLPHYGEGGRYTVFCQNDYELLEDGTALKRAKRIGNYPGKIHRTMGIYLGMGIQSFKVEGRTNDFDYILKRVKDMVESREFYLAHRAEIPGMMHYIRRNLWFGEQK